MNDESSASVVIPVLTDIVIDELVPDVEPVGLPSDMETLIAELQTKLSVGTFELTEQLLHSAFSEIEAILYGQILNRLRQELPELVDSVLREHLGLELHDD